MKKENNLTFNIVRACFCIVTLGLSVLFVNFAIKNPGVPSIKFYIAAGFFGFIGLIILISYPFDIIQAKIEAKILKYGVDKKGKIISAKFILISGALPNVSKRETEYNNKPLCETGEYRIKIAFENEMGKEIKKVALFSPLLNKYQLSYLIEKGQVNIKVYKNKFAFTQEMFDLEIKDMPQDQKVINLKDNKIVIKTGIYFTKSRKLTNAHAASTKEYNLFVKKESSITKGDTTGIHYYCKVKFYANVNGENKYYIKHLSLRDFSRIQANQHDKLPLPLLISDNKAYIDFDRLPII